MNVPANRVNQGLRWDRYQGFEPPYDPYVAASERAEPMQEGVGFGDYFKQITGSGVSLATSALWLGAKLGGADRIAEAINDYGQVAIDYWHGGLSEDAKDALSREFVRKVPEGETGTFGTQYEWGDPTWHTLGLHAAGSLVGTAAGWGAGALATKGIASFLNMFGNPYGRKVLEAAVKTGSAANASAAEVATAKAAIKKLDVLNKVTGAVGFGFGEGAVAGVMTTKSVYDMVREQPRDKLMANERYRQVYESADTGMSDEERHAYAADVVAMEAGSEAGWQTGLLTSILGAPMGAYFGRLLGPASARLSSTIPRALATGAAGEAAQEFLQSGTEQYMSNIALQEFDPSIGAWDDVLNQAIAGAAAGGVLGGFAGPLSQPGAAQEVNREEAEKRRIVAEKIGAELKDAAETARNAGVAEAPIKEIVRRAISQEMESGAAIIELKRLETEARKASAKPPEDGEGPPPPPTGGAPIPEPAVPEPEDAFEEYRAKAREDFKTQGVSDRDRVLKVEALRENVGQGAATAYDSEYEKLVNQAVNERIAAEQQKKATVRPEKAAKQISNYYS